MLKFFKIKFLENKFFFVLNKSIFDKELVIIRLGVIIYCLCKLGHNKIDASSCLRLFVLPWYHMRYYQLVKELLSHDEASNLKDGKTLVVSTIEYSCLNPLFT